MGKEASTLHGAEKSTANHALFHMQHQGIIEIHDYSHMQIEQMKEADYFIAAQALGSNARIDTLLGGWTKMAASLETAQGCCKNTELFQFPIVHPSRTQDDINAMMMHVEHLTQSLTHMRTTIGQLRMRSSNLSFTLNLDSGALFSVGDTANKGMAAQEICGCSLVSQADAKKKRIVVGNSFHGIDLNSQLRDFNYANKELHVANEHEERVLIHQRHKQEM
ncbi:hypothetical protein ACP70R_034570 [Stipagrostis hirtigluma subsp. patula]